MNIFPYSNFHDLNLDWLLQQVKQLRTDVDGLIGGATPYNATPEMDGAGAPGYSVSYARGDHQHPTDTSRASATALADEVTARTNKDLALDGDIAAVDAKIHFSASNPLMDGSPSAGFSTDQARADHIHPTDTSRAAAVDLTQEISDRANADTTLQNNINAVDAKIVLATGAPLMDSSSATPGSSTSMARADHVHPTDTSRASATDLATLTARVDSFTGSAIASDATPQMDGVGSAGTGGNYSRGDHRHPSDTTKVNKSGDTMTGDLRIDGALVPLHDLQFLHVNSIGWIRIADVPQVPGTWAKFAIVRKGDVAPSEIHAVEIYINQSGIIFGTESSCGDVLYIDQIRYTNAGKVDIHMDQTDTSDIGVRLIAAGPTETITNNVKLIPFQGVAPAPQGETVLKRYIFTMNTDATGTPTLNEYGTLIGNGGYTRSINGIVYIKLNITVKDTPVGGWRSLFTIPSGFTPLVNHDFFAMDNSTDLAIHARVSPNGEVSIWPDSAIASGTIINFNAIYPII